MDWWVKNGGQKRMSANDLIVVIELDIRQVCAVSDESIINMIKFKIEQYR